jgi:mevalonate kinase
MDLERFQHGRPSGVDPFVAVHGGLVRYRRGEPPETHATALTSVRLLHTGIPECTTGECVYQVRSTHAGSSIWEEFEAVCNEVEHALQGRNESALVDAVRRNHRLLFDIGVVPPRIARLIEGIERSGGGAKICGAGAVRGDAGGVVWVVGPVDLPDGAGEEMVVDLEKEGAHLVE